MPRFVRSPVVAVWLALVAAALLSWGVGTDLGISARVATVAIIIVAFVKVHLVGRYFMEVREAPRGLRRVFDSYVVGVCAAMIGVYLIAG